MVAREVAALAGDLVEKAAKEIDMLRLFPEEGGQKHLLLDTPLPGDHLDERKQIERDRLFARLEHRGQAQEQVALVGGERCPVGAILGEIDLGRVPDTEAFRLLEQAQRQAGAVETPLACGLERAHRLRLSEAADLSVRDGRTRGAPWLLLGAAGGRIASHG